MANEDHVRLLKKYVGPGSHQSKDISVNFSNLDLSGAEFYGTVFAELNLSNANLFRSGLARIDFTLTNLSGANLSEAEITNAMFENTNLANAKFTNAELIGAVFRGANLEGANFTGSVLGETIFFDVDLSRVVGLEDCEHWGPSVVDFRTLQKSGPLPLSFLRGVGLPEALVTYLPSLLNEAIQHYSCFISYSIKDRSMVDRLYADLQNNGVRCWFAPHDMPIGGKILDEIDSAIRLRDKLLLVLSSASIASDWVEDEVTKAFEEERKRGQTVLFPIRLDDSVIDTDEPWAAKLRARHIGDFREWKSHDEYQKSFERVLRDLTVKRK